MNHRLAINEMANPVVVYHGNCMDGFGAAWAVRQSFGDNAEYVPAMYGNDPPVVLGRDVLIVDFSYPRDVLLHLHAEARSIVVLDHHKSAAEDLRDLPFAVFDMDRSGAGLAWDYCFNKPRPRLIDYIEDRDLWRFALPDSKAINAWIGCVEMNFASYDFLASTLEAGTFMVVTMGEAVLAKIQQYVRSMAKEAQRLELLGHWVPVVNAPYVNTSELVGHLAEQPDVPFAVGWYRDRDGVYRYSLRSRGDFDVSALARHFGGGGHKNAAGFSSPTPVL